MMHREMIILTLEKGRNELEFCSYGVNSNKGAILDDVGMFPIDSCKYFSSEGSSTFPQMG